LGRLRILGAIPISALADVENTKTMNYIRRGSAARQLCNQCCLQRGGHLSSTRTLPGEDIRNQLLDRSLCNCKWFRRCNWSSEKLEVDKTESLRKRRRKRERETKTAVVVDRRSFPHTQLGNTRCLGTIGQKSNLIRSSTDHDTPSTNSHILRYLCLLLICGGFQKKFSFQKG